MKSISDQDWKFPPKIMLPVFSEASRSDSISFLSVHTNRLHTLAHKPNSKSNEALKCSHLWVLKQGDCGQPWEAAGVDHRLANNCGVRRGGWQRVTCARWRKQRASSDPCRQLGLRLAATTCWRAAGRGTAKFGALPQAEPAQQVKAGHWKEPESLGQTFGLWPGIGTHASYSKRNVS